MKRLLTLLFIITALAFSGVKSVTGDFVKTRDTYGYGWIQVPNDSWFQSEDSSGTYTMYMFKVDEDANIVLGRPVVTDLPFRYDAVAGDNNVTVFDSWLGTALADGDSIRHQYRINGANAFEYGALSDGTGGVDGQYATFAGDVISAGKVAASDSLCLGPFRFVVYADTLCSVTGTDTLRFHPSR